jgi:hypothetical protein
MMSRSVIDASSPSNNRRSPPLPLNHTSDNQFHIDTKLYNSIEVSLTKKDGKFLLEKPLFTVKSAKWDSMGVIYILLYVEDGPAEGVFIYNNSLSILNLLILSDVLNVLKFPREGEGKLLIILFAR